MIFAGSTGCTSSLSFPARDAAHVQQILDEPDLHAGVALDGVQSLLDLLGTHPAQTQDLRPTQNRAQRGSELMRQGGQELVLERAHPLGFGPGGTLAVEQLLALAACTPSLRDVPEAPDAPDLDAIDDLDRGIALDHAAVLELQDIEAFLWRFRIDGTNARDEPVGVLELRGARPDQLLVVPALHERRRQPPHIDVLLVVVAERAAIGHQNAIGGRLQGGTHDRKRLRKLMGLVLQLRLGFTQRLLRPLTGEEDALRVLQRDRAQQCFLALFLGCPSSSSEHLRGQGSAVHASLDLGECRIPARGRVVAERCEATVVGRRPTVQRGCT